MEPQEGDEVSSPLFKSHHTLFDPLTSPVKNARKVESPVPFSQDSGITRGSGAGGNPACGTRGSSLKSRILSLFE